MMHILPASAQEFGFSPSSLEFESSEEDGCKDIWLFSEGQITVHIEDLWSEFPSTRIGDYIHNEKFLNYTNSVVFDGKKSVTICLTKSDGRKHYGSLIFNLEGSSISGGMWVRVKGKDSGLMPENRQSLNFVEYGIRLQNSVLSSERLSSPVILIILLESAVISSCILSILAMNLRR